MLSSSTRTAFRANGIRIQTFRPSMCKPEKRYVRCNGYVTGAVRQSILILFVPCGQAVALVNVLATMILPKPDGEGDIAVELMSDTQADNLKDSLDQDIRPVYEEALTRQKVSV